jgi:hypothetical protein
MDMKKLKHPEDWNSIDELIEGQVRNLDQIKPSTDFSNRVMDKIAQVPHASAVSYQPLISKKTWFLLFVLLIALVLFSLNTPSSENTTWLNAVNNYLSNISLPSFSFFHNKIIVNSVVIGCAMLLFQLYFISKKYKSEA